MMSTTEKRRAEFAERVTRSLEAGIIPWQMKSLPDTPIRSAVSGRNYSGLNALYLMERCAEKGYKDPRFITASEANKNGLHVRKGEHGVVIEHWVKGDDGKIKPRGYTVFNVQQLNSCLPKSESEKSCNLEKVAAMLKSVGVEMSPDHSVKEFQNAVKKLTVNNAEGVGLTQTVHTTELLALRYSIASTMVMRETGIPVEQTEGAPTKSWAQSIKRDPSQLFKAARNGSLLAGAVLREMAQSNETELFQASKERVKAQKGHELVFEDATIPRGLDSNSNFSREQESVIAASGKAKEQVNDLSASDAPNKTADGTGKIATARDITKKQLGNNAIVTSAVPGRTYSGKIIETISNSPDKTVIQAISNNHTILHDIKDISAKSKIKIGEDVSLTADEQGYSSIKSEDIEQHSKKNELKREGVKR